MKDTIIHIHHSARTIAASQHGSVLIYIVALILIAGVLGLGIVSMTTTSAFTGLGYNPSDQARFLAKSGMNYAVEQGDELAAAAPKNLILDEGEIKIIFEPADDDNPNRYDITSTGTVFRGTSREARFVVTKLDYEMGNGETNIDFPDDEESELEDYWDNVGFSDADYSSGGQSDGGALEFKGEDGLLGLAWGEIEGLDLKEIRNASDGLLSYDLQVKTKVRPQGNNGDFYMLGLSFRLETEENSKYNGYGLSFFRYTPNVQQNKRPDWVDTLEGFNDLQDGVPYLVLWKKENGGNITLIDYADIQNDHPESFVTGSELNDWVTMAVRVEEKDHPSGEGTENDITAYIEQPPDIEKGEKIWDFSQYIDVNWIINGIGTITDDSLDSSGVDYYEYEIGVHAFYDGDPANQIFFSDFGLKF